MFTYLQQHNKIRRGSSLIATLLLFVILLPLLSSTRAFAAVPPGGASTDFPFCFSTTEGAQAGDVSIPVSYCYATLAACQADVVTHSDVSPPCHDQLATMTKFQKTQADKGTVAAVKEVAGDVVADAALGIVGTALEWIAHALAEMSGKVMVWMGDILDMAIDRTINSATYSNLNVVNIGWTAVRDLSNMFFIFVLLYIAILTILGQAGSSAKRWVVHLVIAALLINFSLFFTKVVIDAGNALSIGIWNNLKEKTMGVDVNGVSQHFSEAFRVQTSFNTIGKDSTGTPFPQPDALHSAMIYFGATLVQCIAAYLFLAGAIMMIIRTVTLLIVMIVSPFAFLGFALPKGGGFASEWLSKLIGATFVAPVFIFMLYLNSIIIHTPDIASLGGALDAKWALAIQGDPASFAIMYQFAIMCIMLLASMTVAQKVGNGVGSSAGGWAKKTMGYGIIAGAGTTAFLGRQGIGRIGKRVADSDAVKKLSAKTGLLGTLGRGIKTSADIAQKSSFDIRNAKGMGMVGAGLGMAGVKMGTGSTSNYQKTGALVGTRWAGAQNYKGTDAEKKIIETLKERYKGNPVALKAALESRFGLGSGDGLMAGTVGGGQLGAYRHKDLLTETNREIATEKEKANIEERAKEYAKAKEEGKLEAMSTREGEEGKTIGKAAADAIKESMSKLSGKEAETIIKKAAAGDKDGKISPENELLLEAISKQQLNHVNANPADFNPDMLKNINKSVMKAGGPGAGYLIQQAKMKSGVFPTNLEQSLRDRRDSYTTGRVKFDALATDTPEVAKQKRLALADFDDKHDAAVQDILGGMSTKEVARLDAKLKSDPAMVRNYTEKHFNEIESYHKNIQQDLGDPGVQKMFENIRTNAKENGTQKTAEYMRKAEGKRSSAYFDKSIIEKHKSALTAANTELAEAQKGQLNGRIADAQKKVKEASDKLKKAQEAASSGGVTGEKEDDEEENA